MKIHNERMADVTPTLRVESPFKEPDEGEMRDVEIMVDGKPRTVRRFVVTKPGRRLDVGEKWFVYRLEDDRWAKLGEIGKMTQAEAIAAASDEFGG